MELAILLGVGALLLVLRHGWEARRARAAQGKVAVLDGSNILYWAGEGPDPDSLRRVIGLVRQAGYRPVVWFDANAGYLIEERYAGPARLGRLFALPAGDIGVAPKGEPADPHILAAARRLKAPVITNDRYRDWPASGLTLVTGRVTGQGATLDWPRDRTREAPSARSADRPRAKGARKG